MAAEKVDGPSLRGLTGWLARRVMPVGEHPKGTAVRTALGEFEGYVSTGVSVLLASVKATLGGMSGSVSLIADAFNNLADVGSSLLIALGFRWSRRPRDIEHPFGHGRVEAVATLLLAVILLGVGAEVARSGIRRLLDPAPIHAPGWLLAAVGLTVAVKTWLALFARALARFTGSKVLEADSWNHTFDIASSLLVVVALGAARMGRPSVDGYAALGVAVCIAYTGWRYGKDAVNELIGRAPSPQQLDSIRALALAVPGVRGVHDIIVHEYGDVRLVSLHIEVSADRSVMDAHELAERVEQKVAAEASAKAVVHVDPVDRKHPAYPQVDHALRHFAAEHAELVGYHDLRINGASDGYDFAVDLVVRTSVQPAQFGRFLEEARDRLHRELAAAGRIELGIETEYASDPEHRLQFMR